MTDNVHIKGDVEISKVQDPKVERFLGMTKLQFLGLILGMVFMLSISTTYSIAYAVRENAKRIKTSEINTAKIEQDHAALCALKDDLQKRLNASQEFLAMTPEERIKKFGAGLGQIPAPTIQASLNNEIRTLGTLKALDCD